MEGYFRRLPHGQIYVHDYGGEGRPVVAVHGLGGAHLNWLPVAEGLSRHGHVLALDLPGFGYSPPQRSHRLAVHAEVVGELIEDEGKAALLVGNSLGGLVSIMVAAHHPQLVDKLVLVAPAMPPRLPDPTLDRLIARRLLLQGLPILGPEMIRRYWDSVSPARQIADTLAVVCHHPEGVPQELVAESLALASARRHQPWALPALVGSGRSTGRYLANRRGLRRLIEKVEAPTLIIKGGHDRVVAGSGIAWLAALRPDWALSEMADAGHCPQIEAPGEFLAIVDGWLGSLAASHQVG